MTPALALSLALLAPAQPPAVIQKAGDIPASVRVERDVAYLGADRPEKADLYLPAEAAAGAKRPAVLIIHGGGWTGGDKGAAREINIGTNLVLHGYVAMSINYVLATKDKPTWPQNLHDCKTAVRWLRKESGRLGIDPDHIGVIGGSAGGHLAAMVTLTGPADKLDPVGPYGEFSARVQCGVDLYGPGDLAQLRADPGLALPLFGKSIADAPELYKAGSPTTYADKTDPPLLILHGTADKTVDVKQSEILAAALKKAGAPHELVIVAGAPHTFHLQPKEKDLRPLVIGFFDTHLKPKK